MFEKSTPKKEEKVCQLGKERGEDTSGELEPKDEASALFNSND